MSFKSPLRALPQFRAGREGAMGALQTYSGKVLSYSPIAYWPLAELSGSTARCRVNSAQNGTYTGVTLGDASGPDGQPCPLFDGANDFVNIYTAIFRDAFDGTEGTAMVWSKVFNVGVWTDGSSRNSLILQADAQNRNILAKRSQNNEYTWFYEANNVAEQVIKAGLSETGWMHIAITWSDSAEEMKAYYNGSQEGVTQVTLGTWVGLLGNNTTCIGSASTAPANPWYGWLAHVAVWDSALSGAAIAVLAAV